VELGGAIPGALGAPAERRALENAPQHVRQGLSLTAEYRETTGYEPFALHAPRRWAIQGYVIKNRG